MAYWLIIILIATTLLLATYYVGEWLCRRIAQRYGVRRRLWSGFRPDDRSDEDGGGG